MISEKLVISSAFLVSKAESKTKWEVDVNMCYIVRKDKKWTKKKEVPSAKVW